MHICAYAYMLRQVHEHACMCAYVHVSIGAWEHMHIQLCTVYSHKFMQAYSIYIYQFMVIYGAFI